MKSLKPHLIVFLVTFMVFSTGLTSCVVHEHHPHRHKTIIIKEKRIPPGHRKEKHHRHHDQDHDHDHDHDRKKHHND